MVQNPFDQLSAAQKTCLRLVAENKSSKEIAIETGLSPQTVDQYVSKAATILAVPTRRAAARLFMEWETNVFKVSEFKPQPVAEPTNSVISAAAEQDGTGWTWKRVVRLVPPIGGGRHDLNAVQTVYAILQVTLVTMSVAAAIIAIVFWLNQIAL